jgi:heavy metal-binding protein
MDIAEIVVTLGGVALMALTLWFFFGKQEPKPKAAQALYSCPMHPWITSSDPAANCSICGMKLLRGDG